MQKMNRLLILTITGKLLLLLTGCCNCPPTTTNNMLSDTILTDKFECLNIALLKRIAKSYSYPQGNAGDTSVDYGYIERNADGKMTLSTWGNDESGYELSVFFDTTNYTYLFKEYYANGMISHKGIMNGLGFSTGKWYYFIGKVCVKTIDFDSPFTFTFAQLKEKLLKEEGVSLDNLQGKEEGTIFRYPVEIIQLYPEKSNPWNRPVWTVSYHNPSIAKSNKKLDGGVDLVYDGQTGEILRRGYTRFPDSY